MSRSFRDTSGGKQVSGGALAPRSKKANNTLQVDSLRRGGGVSPIVFDFLVVAGGGAGGGAGFWNLKQGAGGGGGRGAGAAGDAGGGRGGGRAC